MKYNSKIFATLLTYKIYNMNSYFSSKTQSPISNKENTFTASSRTYFKTNIPYRNPRQQEIWELQSNHQNYLNYLHFKARLEGNDRVVNSNKADTEIRNRHSSSFSNEYHQLELEERELTETLRQEERLLEEAKQNTQLEIDRCKQMLEDFRKERKKKLEEKQTENSSRRKIYEEELESLRRAIANEKSDIKVSIHQIDYMSHPDAEDVSALNKSYDLREQILRTQSNSLKAKSNLTKNTSSRSSKTTTTKNISSSKTTTIKSSNENNSSIKNLSESLDESNN